ADLNVAKLYDMIHPNAAGGKRTAADNATVRSVFVVGPDKKIKLVLTYPMSTGRNFDEVLRVLDSIQLTARHKVATPVNWKRRQAASNRARSARPVSPGTGPRRCQAACADSISVAADCHFASTAAAPPMVLVARAFLRRSARSAPETAPGGPTWASTSSTRT